MSVKTSIVEDGMQMLSTSISLVQRATVPELGRAKANEERVMTSSPATGTRSPPRDNHRRKCRISLMAVVDIGSVLPNACWSIA